MYSVGKYLRGLLPLLLALVVVGSLRAQQPGVRAIDLSPEVSGVDFYLNDTVKAVASGVPYGSASAVTQVTSGLQRVKIALAGTHPDTAIIDSYVTIPASTRVSILVLDSLKKLHAKTLNFPLSSPSNPAVTMLRVVHASPNTPAVDVRITDSAGNQTTLGSVILEGVTQFYSFPSGRIDIEIFAAGGTSDTMLHVRGNFGGGTYETAIISGYRQNLAVRVLHESVPLQQNPLLTLQKVVSGVGRLRFVNGVLGGPSADVFIDNNATPKVTNISFRDASESIPLPAGTHNVKVGLSGLPIQNALFDQDFSGNPDTAYTGIGVGSTSGNGDVVIVARPLALPLKKDSVLVRFINGGANSTNIDIRMYTNPITDLTFIGDQPWKQVTDYVAMPADSDLNVALSWAGSDVFYRAHGKLTGNSAVTLIATGDPATANFKINVLVDNDTSRQSPMRALEPILVKGVFRVVNVASDSLEIYLGSDTSQHGSMGTPEATGHTDDFGGDLNVKIAPVHQGSDKALIDGTYFIVPSRLTTLFVYGDPKAHSLDTLVLHLDESSFEGLPDPNDTVHAVVRVLNLGYSQVGITLNLGSIHRQWNGLGFREATPYVLADSGSFSMKIAPQGGDTGYVADAYLRPQQAYTLILGSRRTTGQVPIYQLNDGEEQSQVPLLELNEAFPLSVNQPASSTPAAVIVRPNPASDAFDVAYTLDRRQQVRIDLTDVTGRVVGSFSHDSQDVGGHVARISAGALVTGSYAVTVRGEDGRVVATGRVVIVR